MDSELSPLLNSLCITHWENYRSQTLPTDSTDEPGWEISCQVVLCASPKRSSTRAALCLCMDRLLLLSIVTSQCVAGSERRMTTCSLAAVASNWASAPCKRPSRLWCGSPTSRRTDRADPALLISGTPLPHERFRSARRYPKRCHDTSSHCRLIWVTRTSSTHTGICRRYRS